MSGPVFGVGMNAGRAEHRSALPATAEHYAGTPRYDASGDPLPCECPRCGAVRAGQERWTPRQQPSTSASEVFAEWLAASPDNRMSALAMKIAEHPEMLPDSDSEENPRPGGLVERLRAQVQERREHMNRVNRSGQMP